MITRRWTKKNQDALILEFKAEVEKQAVGFYFRLNGMNLPVNQDDMVATALLALVKSARQFDPLNGSRFGAYASKSVRNALVDLIKSAEVPPGCMILPLLD